MSSNIVDEIKDKVNIVDVIGKVVSLKRTGTNYKGLCPFHSEKTPSFVVSEDKQIFTCFGCNTTGDVIEFVKRYYNLEFIDAVKKICEEYGIEFKESTGTGGKKKEEFYRINKLAARFFFEKLSKGENPGLTYLTGRGISIDTIKKFGLGYAPDSWNALLEYMTAHNIDRDMLVELGLLSKSKNRYFDKFRNRVIFPIINTSGKVIGFGGRGIEKDAVPKYLNSPETPVFQKKNNLFGINLAKQDIVNDDRIVLVEGYMDVISLVQAGIPNTCASLGTALTANQVKLISRYTSNVILSYDSDEAGVNAALRGIDIIREGGLTSKIAHVTDGKDPDEFIKAKGKNAFIRLMNDASPDIEYKISRIMKGYDLNKTDQRAAFIKKVIPELKKLSPAEMDIYIKRTSEISDISETAIAAELNRNKKDGSPVIRKDETDTVREDGITKPEGELIKLALTENRVIEILKKHKNLFGSRATEILDAVIDIYEKDGEVDADVLKDRCDEELHPVIDNLVDSYHVDLAETLNSCLNALEISRLNRRYKEITSIIDLADDNDTADELLKEQMDIQKRINKLKRR